jgi:hypothetical protein
MKRLFAALPLLIVFVLMAHLSYAPPLPPVSSSGAPLDGFAIMLIMLGALYGGYYVRGKEKVKA